MTREELMRIANMQPSSKRAAKARERVIAKGLTYYASLRKEFPHHWQSFRCMHKRGTPTAFPKNLDGFIDFILYLGEIPSYIVKPSIGRKDHSKGYFPGNFAWQEMRENAREVTIRRMNMSSWTRVREYL